MGCGQGLTFSEASILTPEGAFRTSDWTRTTPLLSFDQTRGLAPECLIYLDPRQGTPTTCCSGGGTAEECETTVSGTLLVGGRHPRFSNDGHWVIAGGTLLHTPSGEQRVLDDQASEALFAPDGDVIAGESDGSIVRFCRRE